MTLLTDLAQFIRSQPDGCHQVVSYYLEAIQDHNDTLNAVSIPLRERALATAQLRDQELRAGHDRGPLHGIPFGIKEVMDVGGVVTTAGCPGYAQRHGIPTQDAALVQRIESAGAIPLAKTQTNDLAYGLDGLNAHYGDTHNPWDPSRISGGSSSGSAAAVCAGLMPIALGTDTGGSVRVPSAYTGIAGIRSTFGQDTRGLVHLVPIFDTVGPMARSAWDVALMQAVLTRDPLPSRRQTLAGIRLGVVADAGLSKLTPKVRTIYDASLASLQSVGSLLEAIQLPPFADGTAFQVFTVLGGVQALATHRAPVEDPDFEMDPRTRQRLERGTTFKGV
ncbi:MAG: amidase, partial [Cyanophyceae cyanobacterium]